MVSLRTVPVVEPAPPVELTPVSVAVVGYGYWGPNLARNVALHDATTLTAIADLSEERLLDAKKDHAWVQLTQDVDGVLRDPDIEAVFIATPAGTHYDLARRALEYGKHVLVEKPLATTVHEAESLVRLADETGRHLMVDHTFLFTGAVRRMKQYFDAGEIGDVVLLRLDAHQLGSVPTRHECHLGPRPP